MPAGFALTQLPPSSGPEIPPCTFGVTVGKSLSLSKLICRMVPIKPTLQGCCTDETMYLKHIRDLRAQHTVGLNVPL